MKIFDLNIMNTQNIEGELEEKLKTITWTIDRLNRYVEICGNDSVSDILSKQCDFCHKPLPIDHQSQKCKQPNCLIEYDICKICKNNQSTDHKCHIDHDQNPVKFIIYGESFKSRNGYYKYDTEEEEFQLMNEERKMKKKFDENFKTIEDISKVYKEARTELTQELLRQYGCNKLADQLYIIGAKIYLEYLGLGRVLNVVEYLD